MTANSTLLNWDETLFKDIEVFDISYVPEQFNYREGQMQQLAFGIKPALRGGRVVPSVCRGLPGTGKTTSIHKLFDEITASTQKIVPIIVNCNIDNTEYAIFARIYNKLTGLPQPASGTSLKTLLDTTAKYIAAEKIIPLVCLDDANYLVYSKELNNVLYPLMRFHEEYGNIDFGVILILSDLNIILESTLDVRVTSVFRYETVEFTPYTAREIAGILNARAAQGLYPKVLPAEIMDTIVDLTMQAAGDIRVGLDLIRRSVLYAENDARKQVTAEDVERAFEQSRNTQIAAIVRQLSEDERMLLRQIVRQSSKKDLTTKMLRDSYKEGVPKATRFNEILEKLQAHQLITLTYVNNGNGRQRIVSLCVDPGRLASILQP